MYRLGRLWHVHIGQRAKQFDAFTARGSYDIVKAQILKTLCPSWDAIFAKIETTAKRLKV